MSENTKPPDENGAYERTTTGYRRADGEEVKRCTLFLTDAQKMELKRRALISGYDGISEYVVDRLGLKVREAA